MANKTNEGVVRLWAHDLSTSGVAHRCAGGTICIRNTGHIEYVRRQGSRSRPFGPVMLGRYLPKTKTVLLNGDGLGDPSATQWQTRLRNNVLNERINNGDKYIKHIAVIPYQALDAAGVVYESILPIHIVVDENIEVWHKMDFDPNEFPIDPPKWTTTSGNTRTLTQTVGSTNITVTERATYVYVNPQTSETSGNYRAGWGHQLVPPNRTTATWTMRATPSINSNLGMTTTNVQIVYYDEAMLLQEAAVRRASNDRNANGWGAIVSGEFPTEPGWYWREVIHHLGASLFSAVDESGKRHKFVSAFDEEEANTMYFLAQLPDRSGATTYQEALLALAPPIVHKARLEGRTVRRQGDVFAIATSLSDEDVYEMAKTRVRRQVSLTDVINETMSLRAFRDKWVSPAPGEVRERILCPCGCGHKRWYGCGPKAKRALMIYNTGHTADEVVTTKTGVTYIRGTMHHDPFLQEAGRQPEHRDVVLTQVTGHGWFLAVRNTVPRKQRKTDRIRVETREGVTI